MPNLRMRASGAPSGAASRWRRCHGTARRATHGWWSGTGCALPHAPCTARRSAKVLSGRCTQVYDVTAFWSVHPGGRVILTYAGRDATDVFATFHAATSWALLREHQIGELAAEVQSASDLGGARVGRGWSAPRTSSGLKLVLRWSTRLASGALAGRCAIRAKCVSWGCFIFGGHAGSFMPDTSTFLPLTVPVLCRWSCGMCCDSRQNTAGGRVMRK